MLPATQPARSHLSGLIGRLVPRPHVARAPFEQYRDDPVGFFRSVLGVEPWGRHHGLPEGEASQIDMILAVRDYPAVACRSGHKTGKALDVNTPIPTPSGWTTMGELYPLDEVLDDAGRPCRVTAVSEVAYDRPCYDVELSDGSVVTADAGHEWRAWIWREDALARDELSAVSLATTELSSRISAWYVDHRHVARVTPRPTVPVRCITVDAPSRMFLAGRGRVPTHNSTSGAGIALWWVLTRVGGHVILTAPTYNQVKKPIWAEIRSFAAQTHPAQRGKTLPDLRKIGRLSLEPNGGFEVGPNWGIWGKSTTKPENIAGPSGAEVLYEVDEASGYDGRLLEAIQGGLAGCGKIVLWGNPTQTSGPFYDAFHEKCDAWKCLHVSSTSTPNFYGPRIPGLADPQWLEDTAKKNWGGPGNAVYDVRVLGKFPGQAPNAIIGLDLLEAAKARWAEQERVKPCADLGPADGRLELGVDVSRDGEDETVVAPRRGKRAYLLSRVTFDPKLVTAKDPVPLGHQAALGAVAVARALRKPNEGKDAPRNLRPRIKVDEIGNGAACLDHLLAHFAEEFEVVGVKVSQRADAEVKVAPGITAEQYYANKRAQVVFGVRDWLVAGGTVPPDPKLDAELVAPTQHQTTVGKTAVEGKDDIKKRLKRSPDAADALALSCYEPPKPPPRLVTYAGDASDENGGWGSYSVG